MHKALQLAANHADAYLASVRDRKVANPYEGPGVWHSAPLPDMGEEESAVLEAVIEFMEPGLLHTQSPRFFAWVIGGATPLSVAADWLVSAWDQNAAAYVTSPTSALIDGVAGRWLKELLGLPLSASHAFVTGCQQAHVTCLAAARYRVLEQRGWNVNERGLYGAPPIRVLSGIHHHETLTIALRRLGMGTDHLHTLTSDPTVEVTPEMVERALAEHDGPAIVCLQAGDLHQGRFDQFDVVCEVAQKAGAWVHVDGAFGLWARACSERAFLARGVEAADSWATDGHKWLNVPYDSGYAFVRDANAHKAAMSMNADYVELDGVHNPVDFTPEWSRRSRAVPTYAAIRALGKQGISEMIERCCQVALRIVDGFGELGAEVVHRPQLNQGLVRFLSDDGDHDARTERICRALNQEGTSFFGTSRWRGMRVIRVSVVNHLSRLEDAERTLEAARRVLADIDG